MISPVTSTNVATNGAEEAAGSNPSRRNRNGNIEPASVPHITTPTSATPTVIATGSQCGPYKFENADHSEIRRKPIEPRIAPSASPASNSRRITRHQSRNVTSPSAIARMINVAACEPELPPLEMINGTNNASTTARAISCSKNPIAVAVNNSPINKMTSQPARLRIIFGSEMWMYGSSSASVPPNFCMSSVAASSATSNTSSTVTMPTSLPAESTTGNTLRSYRRNASRS